MNFAIILFLSIICIGELEEVNNSTLKLALILFRHGDRTPIEPYKNDPYKDWPEGWGRLTNKGKNQMFQLGKTMRNRYSNFLSDLYYENEVFVRSSDMVRCVMSAQLVLAGLFPPVGRQVWNTELLWQPIPILYVPYLKDNLLSLHKPCRAYHEEFEKVLNSEKMKNLTYENKDLYDYLTLHTGNEIRDIIKIHKLHNTLQIERQHNLTMPNWTQDLPWDLIKELATLKLYIYSETLLLQRFTGGVLLKDLIRHFTQRKSNETSLKIILYSAHDSTLVTLFHTLGFKKQFLPDYGAHLIFELHETTNHNHEIRVLMGKNFNASAIQLELDFCPSPCLLSKFKEELRLLSLLPTDWDHECTKLT